MKTASKRLLEPTHAFIATAIKPCEPGFCPSLHFPICYGMPALVLDCNVDLIAPATSSTLLEGRAARWRYPRASKSEVPQIVCLRMRTVDRAFFRMRGLLMTIRRVRAGSHERNYFRICSLAPQLSSCIRTASRNTRHLRERFARRPVDINKPRRDPA